MSENSPITSINPQKPAGTIQISWLLAVVLGIVLIGAGLGAGYGIWGTQVSVLEARIQEAESTAAAQQPETQPETQPEAQPAADEPRQVTRYTVDIDDDPILGPEDAPITIIEFSDFQCPYCQRWHDQVWKQLKQAYPDQIRLVYRDFPLYSIHPEAEPAAVSANCAHEQGKYWDFHNLLFSGSKELSASTYQAFAAEIGLDMDQFNQCVSSNKYQEEVKADFDYASQLGVQSTPTFFINGIALIGAQPYEVFQQVIDLELAGKLSK